MQTNFSERTIALLRYASLTGTDRSAQWRILADRWPEKALHVKLLELAHREYIDYGMSPKGGWLTDKGRAVLAAYK